MAMRNNNLPIKAYLKLTYRRLLQSSRPEATHGIAPRSFQTSYAATEYHPRSVPQFVSRSSSTITFCAIIIFTYTR